MTKGKKLNISKEQLEKYLKKYSYDQIAEKLGCSKWTIIVKVKKFGLKPLGSKHFNKGEGNPAKRKEIREKIKKSVQDLWKNGKYDNRINGMTGRTGFNHPTYSPLTDKKYKYKDFLSQFQDVDKCCMCGSKKKIDIHHIDEDHNNFLITNLEPLCVSCHQKFHLIKYKKPFVTIGKQFKMECCHYLTEYQGKCSRMHGHTYHFTICLKKRIHPDTGMVMDFGDLKKIVDKYIIEKLDHFNLNEKIDFKTTAENMLFWIWKELEEKALLKGLYKIDLWETETSIATIMQEDVLNYEKDLLMQETELIE